MRSIIISCNPVVKGGLGQLPASKSMSNRALLLNALSGNQSTIGNLAAARDTVLMKNLLNSPAQVADVMDAGTTMRFLTAYYAIIGQHKILTGTPRMKQRPIGLLVDALRSLGATIDYTEETGFPPLQIGTFEGQQANTVTVAGNVSSQYISALMMVAPLLPQGLCIELEGKVGSRPYIDMTAALMNLFGADCQVGNAKVQIAPGNYRPTEITIEPDWSALSYWFAMVALASEAELVLNGVNSFSLQGDRVVIDIMEKLGVKVQFKNDSAVLSKTHFVAQAIEWDFTHCPDLAQTVLPVCALKGVSGTFTGLESLYIKETDRIKALRQELAKGGARLYEGTPGVFKLEPGEAPSGQIQIATYHDHRMAMGFAPWATQMEVKILEPEVVNKSYPGFWDHLQQVGFKTTPV